MSAAKRTIRKALVEQLRDEILSGQIKPGTRLRQQEIAARFSISTTPVREAFSALEREGLVHGEAHRGVVVFEPTAQELREIYEIRQVLETFAIRKAAEAIVNAQLEEIRELLTEMEKALTDHDAYHILNGRFHDLTYQASGSPRLTGLIRNMRESVNPYLRLYGRRDANGDQVHEDHVLIYHSLRSHDPDAAAQALARHLARTVDFVTEYLPSARPGDHESSEELVN